MAPRAVWPWGVAAGVGCGGAMRPGVAIGGAFMCG
ncbi:hypothetical protein BSPM4_0065 [Salmonella phage BSPM4]|uniref:Uncharacterized protein n=1 Tax=Salmonella phage BSPM4 TaxID=1958913 RepID=A0A2P0P969_9CAUD|nr:hypothetical protein HWB10_gp65 [Salmonella phage BSPM4]AQY55241.1 hypothetical protein BSPM4_0065 [Salmonella phage BSPM4]